VFVALPFLCGVAAGPGPTETVIRMKVQPMAAPKPALKYQLLPELGEMNPGNPVLGYVRCFMEQSSFFFNKEAEALRERLLEMPLKDVPVQQLQGYGGIALRQADHAARLDTPDWQVLRKLQKEGIELLVPDVQQLRRLAWALRVRLRIETAGGRFEDALTTAKTMFALARHLGEHPTLIGDLVGLAIAESTTKSLEEMVQQPGCPNLHWALADLPRPFIDLRKGLQGERVALAAEFAELDTRSPMSDARLARVVDRARRLVWLSTRPNAPRPRVRAALEARAGDEAHVRAARKRLVESGLAADKLRQFPALQIVLLDEKHALEVLRDEATKAMALPFWQWQAERTVGRAAEGNGDPLLARYVPGFSKVRKAQARLEQRLALLRCVEALRLYAAEHGGRLPARLADVRLPLPVDPVTGRPLAYHRDGTTARLHGSAPRGMEKTPEYNIRYEVTLRK
jgi:hypothetical protein